MPATAYEIRTHESITARAFEASVLPTYFTDELRTDPTSPLATEGARLDVPGWLVLGSAKEDDVPRFVNHFYDPQSNQPLTISIFKCLSAFLQPATALQWAQTQPFEQEHTRFTWSDARRAFQDALVGEGPGTRADALARALRTLGHLVHLVQDLGQPQHTRNDPHAGFFGCGRESLFERGVRTREATFDLTGYPPPMFGHFLDFLFTGDGRGLAEFSSHNFVSEGTNFTFAEDGNHHPSHPRPALDLTLVTSIPIENLLPERGLTGSMLFFGNSITDLLLSGPQGQIVNPFMTTFSLFDRALTQRGKELAFSYNRFNVDAAARLLLPRATGYSAGLLNHFFRGKLEAGLADDGGSPRVVGNNASNEPLGPGTLQVYSETTAGERQPASQPTAVGVVAPGGALPPVNVTIPENTKQLIAVYRGRLGNEVDNGLESTSPGAVIGKVFNGVRVEEIFNDSFDAWFLRTPRGVFRLPLTLAAVPELRWGDGDDTLVAVSPAGNGDAATFHAYRLEREAGTSEPRMSLDEHGNPVVALTPLAQAVLPADFDLEIRVDFTERFDYQQHFLGFSQTLDTTVTPNTGTVGEGIAEVLVNETRSLSRSFPLTLSLAHTDSGAPNYSWRVHDLAFTMDGRILAEIDVALHGIEWSVTVPQRTMENTFGAPGSEPPRTIDAAPLTLHLTSHPGVGSIRALVDVTNRTVLMRTAPPVVTVARTGVSADGLSRVRLFTKRRDFVFDEDGHVIGTQFIHTGFTDLGPAGGCQESVPMQTLGQFTVDTRGSFTASYLHADLVPLQFSPLVEQRTLPGQLIVRCPSGVDNPGIAFDVTRHLAIERPTFLDLRRIPQASGATEIAVAMNQPDDFNGRGRLVRWIPRPAGGEAQVRLDYVGDGFLGTVGSDAAVLFFFRNEDFDGSVVKLRGPLQPPDALGSRPFAYRILGANTLYNTSTMRFHARASLAPLQIPAPLAPFQDPDNPNPLGHYHVIGLR
jgi:hypothetical protein